jgi:hypothetical protein
MKLAFPLVEISMTQKQMSSTISVRLNSSKPKHLIGNDRLFEGLSPVFGTDFSIPHGLFLGRTNVAKERLAIETAQVLPELKLLTNGANGWYQ